MSTVNSKMTLREPKTDDDIQLLARMNQQLIRDEGHHNPMTLAELEQRMRGWLVEEYSALIIQNDTGIFGYVLFRQETDWLYLRHFFIAPAFRRKGLGKLAVQKLREEVWKGSKVRLEVLVSNPRGMAFWKSVGFGVYSFTMEHKND